MGSYFLLCVGLCLAASPWLVDSEKRVLLEPDQDRSPPEGWLDSGLADDNEPLRLTFAVKHSNKEDLLQTFWDVSSPKSDQYGQFLSHDEVMSLVAPSKQSIEAVESWLGLVGVNVNEKCRWTQGREFVSCEVMCGEASRLLGGVEFHRFRHAKHRRIAIRAKDAYSVPESVAEHLDFVGGVHRFPHIEKNLTRSVASPNSVTQTPSTLRKQYGVDKTVGIADEKNIQSVVQFLNQHYSPIDLKEFFVLFGEGFVHLDEVAKVIGPNHFPGTTEASLDVEYIMSLGANITTWFWSISEEHQGQEAFLLWIEQVANTSQVPWVFSLSYGDNEDSLSTAYMERVNQEFQKQGVRGISVLFASGDSGAGCQSDKFRPAYPASSPFVTAVGGTQGGLLSDNATAASLSGGGFSRVFSQPEYQKSAVDHYFQVQKNLPSPTMYNRTGRAYPDVSAMALVFLVVLDFVPIPVEGTSCAAPTAAGVFSLVNDNVVRQKSTPMGFLNPFLYTHQEALTDITTGCQMGCGGAGFCCAQGWDPVTGIGAPYYPALVKAAITSKLGKNKQKLNNV